MLVLVSVILFMLPSVNLHQMLPKCCCYDNALNKSIKCGLQVQDNTTTLEQQLFNVTKVMPDDCFYADAISNSNENESTLEICKDDLNNGTNIIFLCKNKSDENQQCNSLLEVLNFWGASMVILATIIYTIPYFIVTIIYFIIPELRIRAYDKSVLAFNASYLLLNCLLIFIGVNELCHKTLSDVTYGILGLLILFLTQASCLWLFVICFDMASVITRFHWAPDSDSKRRDDRKKFLIYSALVWGLTIVPTVIATVMEFNSFLPENSPLRPNFSSFHGEHNMSLIIYTLFIPVLVFISNTILFIYTTHRMIQIQKENVILNTVKSVKRKYFLYVKLYLIMDAPWLSGALSAIFPTLWILKFFRIIQPILMLLIVIPRKNMTKIYNYLGNSCRCCHGGDFRERLKYLRGKKFNRVPNETCITLKIDSNSD